MLLDEVHTALAETFQNSLKNVKVRFKLGLCVTLVREDGKIGDLDDLVGPVLNEADSRELQAKGYIARVRCSEVRCPMIPSFNQEYVACQSVVNETAKKNLLCVLNPKN